MQINRSISGRMQALTDRARIFQSVRQFFIERGYLEVDTPFRIPAPIPELHIDLVSSGDWFLHASPEICMKRMLAAGYQKIFQICHCWRDGERGKRHLPEFTMLEWYQSGANYLDLMFDCETLIRFVATSLGKETISYAGMEISIRENWERISVRDAFVKYADITMEEALSRDIFDIMMVERIEPRLGLDKPTFLHDYPAELGSLALLKQEDPTVAERFELYVGGIELANAFSELTDPVEQLARFNDETSKRHQLQRKTYPIPYKFLSELANMPPSAGIALGIDRLVMVLLDARSIDDVIAFSPEDL